MKKTTMATITLNGAPVALNEATMDNITPSFREEIEDGDEVWQVVDGGKHPWMLRKGNDRGGISFGAVTCFGDWEGRTLTLDAIHGSGQYDEQGAELADEDEPTMAAPEAERIIREVAERNNRAIARQEEGAVEVEARAIDRATEQGSYWERLMMGTREAAAEHGDQAVVDAIDALGIARAGKVYEDQREETTAEEGIEYEAHELARDVLEGSDASMGWREAGYHSALEAARVLVGAGGDEKVTVRAAELVAEKLHE